VAEDDDLDHVGSRRLTTHEEVFWYSLAALSYVVASIVEKGLLNWLVGPIWLVTVVWFGPAVVDRLRARR
jgi:hypothetical protein